MRLGEKRIRFQGEEKSLKKPKGHSASHRHILHRLLIIASLFLFPFTVRVHRAGRGPLPVSRARPLPVDLQPGPQALRQGRADGERALEQVSGNCDQKKRRKLCGS